MRPSHSSVVWPYQYSILNNMAISSRCYLAIPVQYPEQYGHLIKVLSGHTRTVSWTIWPSHSGVIWPYQYSIQNNMAISFRCYLVIPVQYPEQYGHLTQVLSGRTSTISWTIWPSHSGVIWPYRYSILNNMATSFRCYLVVALQYPDQYGHLIQVLSGSTSTISWTIWPSHSGVIW